MGAIFNSQWTPPHSAFQPAVKQLFWKLTLFVGNIHLMFGRNGNNSNSPNPINHCRIPKHSRCRTSVSWGQQRTVAQRECIFYHFTFYSSGSHSVLKNIASNLKQCWCMPQRYPATQYYLIHIDHHSLNPFNKFILQAQDRITWNKGFQVTILFTDERNFRNGLLDTVNGNSLWKWEKKKPGLLQD